MTNHKRSQPKRDPRNVAFVFVPGIVVELTPCRVADEIDGVKVQAKLDWDVDRLEPRVDSLKIERGSGVIEASVLRSISLPRLIGRGGALARIWVDDLCTVPFDEAQQSDESLEEWAARLFYANVFVRRPAAGYIADVQAITVGSAYQRLTVCRKMGLLDLAEKKQKELVASVERRRYV